jgi:glycine oxidase
MQRHSVAIAGAGIIGASIGWRLAQAGMDVTLFDAGVWGGEASSAAAGMLSPGGEFDKPSRWFDLGIEGMRRYPAFVDELRVETGLPIDFRISGGTQVASSETEREEARCRAEFQSFAGIRVEMTPEGLFYPEDGFVDPSDLLRALRSACDAHKVRVMERHPVREIESTDYFATVIAAGAWSGQIRVTHRKQAVAIPGAVPVKGHLIGFEWEPGTLGPMRRHGHTYVLQRSNGFTVAGSTEEQVGFDRRVDPALCEDIRRRAARLCPALDHMTPSRRWIGFRPRPADESGPYIGRVPNTNIWLAYGHYRNGILLAPLTAEQIAGEIKA